MSTTRKTTDTIVIHHSATPWGVYTPVTTIAQWHKARGFDTIGYHYVVQPNGIVEVGRKETLVGAHARGINSRSIGICLVGTFHTVADIHPDQLVAVRTLIQEIQDRYGGELNVIGHRDVPGGTPTECPGFNVRELMTWERACS